MLVHVWFSVLAGACWEKILCSSGPSACYILVPCSCGFIPSWSMFHMFTYFTCHISFYLFHMCFICFHVLHVWCLQYILNFLQRVFWGKAFSCAWSLVLGWAVLGPLFLDPWVWEIQGSLVLFFLVLGVEKSRWWGQVVRNPGGESSDEGFLDLTMIVKPLMDHRLAVFLD